MERQEMGQLQKWQQSSNRKPLIIRGARQVGKTWLMKEFGRTRYPKYAYVNFESNASLKELFVNDFDIRRIIRALEIETGVNIEAENTLLILDEIQEAKGALTSLKYFQENAPEYHVISGGSLLGVALSNATSFPVGKVDFMDLFPFTFVEFLQAINEKALANLLISPDWDLIKAFSNKFIERLRQYYFVGGMPEAVLSYSENADFGTVRKIQKDILTAYELDFSKHAPKEAVPRIRMVWNSIPGQLAKENRKFVYGLIREGARAREYELAISWLTDSGLLHKVTNVTKPGIPLKAYEEPGGFKLFLSDIGLLSAMTNLNSKTVLEGNRIFEEYKGSLTEQYVFQQLSVEREADIYYWSPDSRAEVDFLVQYLGNIIPVEVKAAENLKSKSLKVYRQKFEPETVIRTSMSDYRDEKWMINIPLYAISTLFNMK